MSYIWNAWSTIILNMKKIYGPLSKISQPKEKSIKINPFKSQKNEPTFSLYIFPMKFDNDNYWWWINLYFNYSLKYPVYWLKYYYIRFGYLYEKVFKIFIN